MTTVNATLIKFSIKHNNSNTEQSCVSKSETNDNITFY